MKRKPKPIETDSPAELLRQCREESGVSRRQLRALGESTGTVHRIESAESDPGVGVLARILSKLGWRLKLVAERDP